MGVLIDLNSPKPITVDDLPSGATLDSELQEVNTAHKNEADPHSQYLLKNPVHIEFKPGQFNAIDFNTQQGPNGEQRNDFDGRIIASGGGATNGLGFLLFQFGHVQFNSRVSINNGAQLARMLSAVATIDLPLVAAGNEVSASVNTANALIGDVALFIPTGKPTNLTFFNIQAVVSSAGIVTVYFRNLGTSAIDLPSFSGRVVVLGF